MEAMLDREGQTAKSAKRYSTQLNVRIDPALKERGDAVFEAAGYTASDAVRMLYEFAAAHEQQPETIAQALEKRSDEEQFAGVAERQRRCEERQQGWQIIDNLIAALGIESNTDFTNLSYRELRDLMYEEKLSERCSG